MQERLIRFLSSKPGLIDEIIQVRKAGGMRTLSVNLELDLYELYREEHRVCSREMQVNGSLMLHHSGFELLSQNQLDWLVENSRKTAKLPAAV